MTQTEHRIPVGHIDIKRPKQEFVLLANTRLVKAIGIIITNDNLTMGFVVNCTSPTDNVKQSELTALPVSFSKTLPLSTLYSIAEYKMDQMLNPKGTEVKTQIVEVTNNDPMNPTLMSNPRLSEQVEEDYERTLEWLISQCIMVPIAMLVDLHNIQFNE